MKTESEQIETAIRWYKKTVSYLKRPKVIIAIDFSKNSEEDNDTSVVKVSRINPFVY